MSSRCIYVASSWRNTIQPGIVSRLRFLGHEVYDFRNPTNGNTGFSWADIDPYWQSWTPEQFYAALDHKIAKEGFRFDFEAMKWADTFVLIMPCGRSAHLELGWACGAGKETAILLTKAQSEPELMYKLADLVTHEKHELTRWLSR